MPAEYVPDLEISLLQQTHNMRLQSDKILRGSKLGLWWAQYALVWCFNLSSISFFLFLVARVRSGILLAISRQKVQLVEHVVTGLNG